MSSTTPLRASTKLNSFIPCWYSSTLCAWSQRAAPVNFSRSQNAAIPRYWYHAVNSELIWPLMARSTSAFIESKSPHAGGRHRAPGRVYGNRHFTVSRARARRVARSPRLDTRVADPPTRRWSVLGTSKVSARPADTFMTTHQRSVVRAFRAPRRGWLQLGGRG